MMFFTEKETVGETEGQGSSQPSEKTNGTTGAGDAPQSDPANGTTSEAPPLSTGHAVTAQATGRLIASKC